MSPKLTLVNTSKPLMATVPADLVNKLTDVAMKRLNIGNGANLVGMLGSGKETTNRQIVANWIRSYLLDPAQHCPPVDLESLCDDLYRALVVGQWDRALDYTAPR